MAQQMRQRPNRGSRSGWKYKPGDIGQGEGDRSREAGGMSLLGGRGDGEVYPAAGRRRMTPQQIELMKLQIEVQLNEYEQAISDYAEWYADWKRREGIDHGLD